MNQAFYDSWPLWEIFIGMLLILFLAAEAGFWIGKWRSRKSVNTGNEEKQSGAIMGASLGLLAFLLAFTFSMATNIHAERKVMVLEEANAIGTFYLRTDLLNAPFNEQIRNLLREYVNVRLSAQPDITHSEILAIVRASEDILDKLWPATLAAVKDSSEPASVKSLLIQSANEVIDTHGKRMNAVFKRLPEVVILTLIIIAFITLSLMGYQSGLTGVRVLIPRSALIASLSTVMILVVDLDRPGGTLISISQKMMIDLQQQISETRP